MGLLRAFIAIEFPPHLRNAIEKETAGLRRALGEDIIRWIPAQNMHLTLKFIGDIAGSHVEFLKQLLMREAALHMQFDLQLGGLGAYPNSRKPRVLWIGVHAPADLAILQKKLESGVTRLGYEQADQPFSPHLTIGRVRQNINPLDLPKIRAAMDNIQLGNIGIARIDSIHLIKSDLQPSGSIYTRLFSAPLSKSRGEI
ncbi:MAG: RNA 2',3'-cyclic phosphodiesterase [Anaerolineales bacterium]|nr:RNA 2',3'-cyclic phosphodiesterase [Anaerolineales bacterium]